MCSYRYTSLVYCTINHHAGTQGMACNREEVIQVGTDRYRLTHKRSPTKYNTDEVSNRWVIGDRIKKRSEINECRWSIKSVSDWRHSFTSAGWPDRVKFYLRDQLSNWWLIGDRSLFRLKLDLVEKVVGRGWQKIGGIRRQNSVEKRGILGSKLICQTEPGN